MRVLKFFVVLEFTAQIEKNLYFHLLCSDLEPTGARDTHNYMSESTLKLMRQLFSFSLQPGPRFTSALHL